MVLQKTTAEITKLQVAMNETVKHCYRPLVSDCAFEGRLAMKMVIVVVMVALRACRLFYLSLGSCTKAKLPHFAAIVLLWTTMNSSSTT